MKRALFIDGQLFQSAARDRGMGRYAICLIQAILASKDSAYDKVTVVLSENISSTNSDIKDIRRLFPGVEVRKLNLWTTKSHSFEACQEHNAQVLQKNVDSKDHEVDYFIPALFQEPTVCIFPEGVNKWLLFYDLVPLLYHARYAPLIPFENYLKRFSMIFKADVIFTISKTVADDLRVYLGIDQSKITNIDGAAIKAPKQPAKPQNFSHTDKFILMPTSDDPRKNNLRAVLGFEEFRNTKPEQHYKLVITSSINKREIEHLKMFSEHLIFTGNLKEEELDWLYTQCEVVLFVPEYEGLGLPILEAVSEKKKIVCSSISVFKEISEDAFFYCNHESQESIAAALARATKADAKIDTTAYKTIEKHFTWENSAACVVAQKNMSPDANLEKPRIAMFIPAPSGLSAIGKVVAETHQAMTTLFNVDYYVENGLYGHPVRPDYLKYVANCYPAQTFSAEKYAQYDAVVYHIGNGDYHLESLKNASYLPGYVILHDTFLKDAFRVLAEEGMISKDRVALEELLDIKLHTNTSKHLTTLLNGQLGVLTHSAYALEAASQVLQSKDVHKTAVNLPTGVPEMMPSKDADRTTIGLAGIIADIKGIGVIENIAEQSDFSDCTITLFGFNFMTDATLDRLGRYPNLFVTTNVSDFEFAQNISKLDYFMNFRKDYHGETSLSTLEAMRQGVIVIVKDVGWYSELPDTVVIKASTEDEAIEKLKEVMADPAHKERMSVAAKQYVHDHHSHSAYVEGLQSLIALPTVGTNSDIAAALKNEKIKTAKQYSSLLEASKE